jgi:predicted nucleotidyltransferase
MTGRLIDPPDLRRRLRERRAELLAAAARRGASNLRVFGSVARGDDLAGSDVDFLVDFEASRR